MTTIEHQGRYYFVKSIVWLKYVEDITDDSEPDGDETISGVANDSILEIGFADGGTVRFEGHEASNTSGLLGQHFQTEFRG